jgi:hypothetical protein
VQVIGDCPADRLAQPRQRGRGDVRDGLQAEPGQVLGERERGWSEADGAVDRATARFGAAAVRPATLIGTDRA